MRTRKDLAKARRIVIKVGTSVVSKPNGDVDARWARSFAEQISALRRKGKEVIVVSSGAIGAGRHVLKLAERPKTLVEKQAAAAVGQPRLMRVFKDAFRRVGLPVAQILLTYDDLDSKLRCRNAVNTINLLLRMGVVPIINENDTVAVEEIKFGDNDYLSALTFEIMEAEALILLTDVEGVLAPANGSNGAARVIASVSRAMWAEVELGITSATSAGGTGGMKSKIEAARAAVEHGGMAVIARGKNDRVLERIFAGENVGTFFG